MERQKQYTDTRRRPLEFQVGDLVFLRVSPMRGVNRFGVKGKLKPRFVGPFEVTARVGDVSYRLALPPSLAGVHDVFHVSQLRACIRDPSEVIEQSELPELSVEPDLSFEERPLEIVDRMEKRLRRKIVRMVKVSWKHQSRGDSTWEMEDEMRERYPFLFDSEVIYLSLNFPIIPSFIR